MKKWAIILGALCAGLAVAACAIASSSGDYPSGTWRYKMTVAVETPEGIKTGSAIREISAVSRPKRLGESNDTHIKLERGEAVVIDVGANQPVFALLKGKDDAITAFFKAFPSHCSEGPASRCGIRYYSNLSKANAVELAVEDYPMFAAFKNTQDPKSIVALSQTGSQKNHSSFESFFGKKIKILSVKIEATNESFVSILYNWLPWLKTRAKQPGTLGGGVETPFKDPTDLWITPGHFIKE